jgi:glucosyl-3-phosphoglycerate synthase
MIRTFSHGAFPASSLIPLKGDSVVSVCLPARNEQETVGPIVEVIRAELVDRVPLVDEILVVDDHSDDATADVAAAAGAKVVHAETVLPEYGEGHGKGEALWKSLFASQGDLVVWCDADLRQFDPGFVPGLLGPLLTHLDVHFVKGFYRRPLTEEGVGGGRVTELAARPILSLLFPELTGVVQPLAGEYAGRRAVLEQLPFVQGYGVELGLLIDVAARFGLDALAQTDLGTRLHRNRPLDDLSPQAMAVLQTALRRARPDLVGRSARLVRPGLDDVEVDVAERPPMATVPDYRRVNPARPSGDRP